MKPFNLEEALSGKKVVTRFDIPVSQIGLSKDQSGNYKIIFCIEGKLGKEDNLSRFRKDGTYAITIGQEHKYDLFMAE